MAIEQLVIELPQDRIAFLESVAAQQNVTISVLIDQYIQQMRIIENYKLHPDAEKFAGIISVQDDTKVQYLNHMRDKHK